MQIRRHGRAAQQRQKDVAALLDAVGRQALFSSATETFWLSTPAQLIAGQSPLVPAHPEKLGVYALRDSIPYGKCRKSLGRLKPAACTLAPGS